MPRPPAGRCADHCAMTETKTATQTTGVAATMPRSARTALQVARTAAAFRQVSAEASQSYCLARQWQWGRMYAWTCCLHRRRCPPHRRGRWGRFARLHRRRLAPIAQQ
eukprot:365023-Chlamydomonas_euryale.AAC.15